MLLRLPYLALTSVFAFIRLLPMSDTDKDIEILALRHRLVVLQRQIDKPRLTPPGRAFLAALLHRLPRLKLRQLHLIVSPDTVLRGHRDLVLAENPSTLLRAVPGIMDLDQLGSAITAVCIANDGCGMMARRVATTDIPRRDECPRAPATHADE